MGVYSNLAVQKINEQQMLENFRFSNLIEFAIDIEKSDQAMFDAMLEMDFHEAYESKGIITLTEGEKIEAAKAAAGKMWEKIVKALQKFSSMIKTYVAKLSNVFAELTKKNARLLNDLPLDKAAILKAAEGKDIKVTVPKNKDNEKSIIMSVVTKFKNDFAKCTDGSVSVEDAQKAVKSELDTTTYSDIEGLFDKKSVVDFVNSAAYDGLASSVKDPKADIDQIIKSIEGLQKAIEDKEKEFTGKNKGDNTEDRAKCSQIVGCLNAYMNGTYKLLSFVKAYYARVQSCERGTYAKLGALCKVKAPKAKPEKEEKVENKPTETAEEKTDKTEESSIEYTFMAIDVINETYIEELFA